MVVVLYCLVTVLHHNKGAGYGSWRSVFVVRWVC